jgi:hypothetical protein
MDFIQITSIVTALSSTVLALVTYILVRNLKKKGYDEENHKANFEGIRHSLENKIYSLNDRLIQNEERWKDVNHLLLRKEYLENDSPNNRTKQIHYSEFLRANGISENELNPNNRLVFVLTPFNDQFYDEFMTVKGVCTSMGFTCIRGDEKQFKGDIFPEMLRYIVQSKIVIANINGRNPNVLYELGVAQALDKSVILISKEPKDLPIDIKSQRFLVFNDSNTLSALLKVELQKFL